MSPPAAAGSIAAAGLSDPRTGLCSKPEPGPGPWPLADVVPRFRARLHLPGRPITVAGAALTPEAARSACLGEAAERYAALVPRTPALTASERDLRDRGLRYVAAATLGADPAPGPREPLDWLRARDGRLVPSAAACGDLVGVPLAVRYPQGSTGLAAAPAFDWAVGSAAAEVVERDTVARAWATGELKAVRPENVLPPLLMAATREAGLDVAVHLLPTTCTDSVVPLVALQDLRTGYLGAGAAYRTDLTAAVTKAWVEAVVSVAQAAELADAELGPGLSADAGLAPWRADRRYARGGRSAVSDLAAHTQLLLDPELADRVWRQLTAARAAPIGPPTSAPGRAPRELARHLFGDLVEVDLTSADLRAAGGLVVVRVLAPGASTVRPVRPGELPCPLI